MVLRGDSWLGLGVTPSLGPCGPGNFIQVSCVQAKCTVSPLGHLLPSLSNTVEFLELVEATDAQRLSSLPPALSTLRSHRTIKHGTKKSHPGDPLQVQMRLINCRIRNNKEIWPMHILTLDRGMALYF